MIRYWILAVALTVVLSGVTEARGRNRGARHHGHYYPSQSSVRYSTGMTQPVVSNHGVSGSRQQIQSVSFSGSNSATVMHSSSAGQGGSMQAWAEEEARLMASRGTCGHVRSAPPGYFVGVGCGMTCMGSGTLVGEASFQGKTVRVWQR